MHSPTNRTHHRFLGLALSLAMVLSLFSVSLPAYAAEEGEIAQDEEHAVVRYNDTDYVSLKAALNNVDTTDEEDDVLILLKDIDMDAFDDLTEEEFAKPEAENGIIDKTVTLDLAGHTISGSDKVALLVTPEEATPEEVTVTLTNSSTEKDGVIRNTYAEAAEPAADPAGENGEGSGDGQGVQGTPGSDTVVPPADTNNEDNTKDSPAEIQSEPSDASDPADPAEGTDSGKGEPAMPAEDDPADGSGADGGDGSVAVPAADDLAEPDPEGTDGINGAGGSNDAGDPEVTVTADPAEGDEGPAAVKGNFVLADGASMPEDVDPEDLLTLTEITIVKAEDPGAGEDPTEEETYTLTVKTYFNKKAFTGSQTITIGTTNTSAGLYSTTKSIIGPTTASKYEGIEKGEEITVTNPATKCYGAVSVKANGVELGGAKNMTLTIEEDTVLEVTYGKTGKFIFIDPGHGGSDPGSSSKFNGKRYTEKARMWVLSQKVVAKLNTYDNIVAVCDRRSIESCPDIVLRGKASKGFDLFVSLHSNAGPSSADYPLVIVPYETKYKSAVSSLANSLGSMMKSTMGTKQNYQVWSRTWKFSGVTRNYYGVIRGAAEVKTPGIIIEHSFNTNKKSMLWLMSDSHLQTMANNEAKLIADWAKANKWSSPMTAATVKVQTDLNVTGANYPVRVVKGRSFTVKGTVTSASGLKRVQIGVVDRDTGKWISGHYLDAKDLSGKTYDVAKANSSLNIKTLAKGKYYYRIVAYNVNGVSNRVLNKTFTIDGPKPVLSGSNYPTTIKKGKPFSVKGTIVSPTKIKRVQIGVVRKSTGKWVSYAKYDSKSVNALKFSISRADSSLRFRKLPKGKYYYRIVVTNQDGTYRIRNRAFTVK